MTKFLFLIGPYPQETGIIRAMETGNTSPSLSFSPPLTLSPSSPPLFLLVSLLSDVHLFVQIIRCRDLE